jgi:hypothetical protein
MPGSIAGWYRPSVKLEAILRTKTRTVVAIWLTVVVAFVGSHFHFYFQQTHYEWGDLAANALQILKAKAFRELYGNYSRFGFHHPGPFFFYAYATGEALLFDTLKVFPSPYNAHLFTGVLIQAFFFAWSIAIVDKHVRRPLFVPLVLLFASFHFGMVNFNIPDSAFENIWPPYVLLCPFLCLVIAGASVASGDASDLVPLVLAGCVLVQAHVAQPLFVIPIFLLAHSRFCYSQAARSKSVVASPRAAPLIHTAALVIVLVFLFPIIIDALRGGQSNLRLILTHFVSHGEDHKSCAQSFVYLASFFCYVAHPEVYCDHLTRYGVIFLASRWPFIAMWIILAAIVVLLPRFQRSQDAGDRVYIRWLVIFFALALLLTLIWGTLQNAEMFAFNAYFNFGLLFIPFILTAVVLAWCLPLHSATYLRPVGYLAAIPLLALASKDLSIHADFPTETNNNAALVAQVQKAALTDRQSTRTKFLLFEHDNWPWAATVALALERSGYRYSVSPDWAFMFDRKHIVDLGESLRRGKVALWKIGSPDALREHWISNSPPVIDPTNFEILFSGLRSNAGVFVVYGWDISAGPFSWSIGDNALLYFACLPALSDVEIDLEVFPEDFSSTKAQRIFVSFNDSPPQVFQVNQSGILKYRIPSPAWNSRAFATLAFQFPDAVSPRAVGISSDPRKLSCGFIRVGFHPVSALD